MKKLGFGCMRFPMRDQKIDMQELKHMVDVFMERGFTYFDTSYVYHNGESEKVLKEVLVQRYPRESFTITTKSPVFLLNSRQHFFEKALPPGPISQKRAGLPRTVRTGRPAQNDTTADYTGPAGPYADFSLCNSLSLWGEHISQCHAACGAACCIEIGYPAFF